MTTAKKSDGEAARAGVNSPLYRRRGWGVAADEVGGVGAGEGLWWGISFTEKEKKKREEKSRRATRWKKKGRN